MSNPLWRQAFARLAKVLGPESAQSELKWMLQAARRDTGEELLPSMVDRRVAGEPLQYILGTQPFGHLELLTRPPVLIPRPETEDWTIKLAEFMRPTPVKPASLLDLCTGTGCIPLLLCSLWPAGSVHAHGVDISQDAVALAQDNARRCGVHVLASDVSPSPATAGPRNTFNAILADIRDPAFIRTSGLRPPFDVITSNPPYIPKREYDNLPQSVKDFEDIRALLGDPDPGPTQDEGGGLTFYHTIAELLSRGDMLTDQGVLAVEVGKGQAREVENIMRGVAKLGTTEIWKDPWGIERVVVASK